LAGLVLCMVGPHEPRPGGVTTQVEALSRCLRGDGVEVRPVDTNIQTLRRLGRPGRWLLPLGQLGVVPWRLWRASRGADLIHVHLASYWGFYLPMLAIALVRAWRRLPVVASYHGGKARPFVAAQRSRVAALLKHVDLLLTSAQAIAAVFEDLGLHPILMPNVVDLDAFDPQPARTGDLPARPAPLLLWIKRFDNVSNPTLMVRAYALVRRQIPAARLVMIGDGPRRAEIEALAAGLGAPVEFAGRVSFEALKAAYAAADVFVSSSAVDNQPNTLLEASTQGLPIVATAVGGVPEMVHDGVDALLAPPDDPEALAQAIMRLLTEPGLAQNLSRAAIANAQRFTWDAVRPQMMTVYGTVLGRLVDW
jgi:phenylacetate-CoA ligase